MVEFEHNGKKYVFGNAMEDFVLEKVRLSIASDKEMCKCKKCYYDVCAIVLNNLEDSKYVTSPEGAVISRVAYDTGISGSGVFSVEIVKAMNLVSKNPTH
jgi:hypothetical protein